MHEEVHDAAYYQQHRNDPDVWGDPEESGEPPRRSGLTATITVRFSAEEAETIRRMARETGMTYSEIIRKAVDALSRPQFVIREGYVSQILSQHSTTATVERIVNLDSDDGTPTAT